MTGQDLDDASHSSLRSDWLFDISDSTSLRVFAQYFEADNNGAAMKGLDDPTPDPRQLRQTPFLTMNLLLRSLLDSYI